MWWVAPKIWQGGRCFVIGGGPSLLRQFDVPQDLIDAVYAKKKTPAVFSPFLEPLHNEHIIGVNMAYKLGNWIDVVFFGDGGFWTKNRDDLWNEYRGVMVSCLKEKKSSSLGKYINGGVKVLRRTNTMGINASPKFLNWNLNSGSAAINLAVHFGVKEIILLGFDMKLDEGKNQHWHKFYGGNPKTVHGTFRGHKKGFPVIREHAKNMGVKIINASPTSTIEEFEKVHVKEVL